MRRAASGRPLFRPAPRPGRSGRGMCRRCSRGAGRRREIPDPRGVVDDVCAQPLLCRRRSAHAGRGRIRRHPRGGRGGSGLAGRRPSSGTEACVRGTTGAGPAARHGRMPPLRLCASGIWLTAIASRARAPAPGRSSRGWLLPPRGCAMSRAAPTSMRGPRYSPCRLLAGAPIRRLLTRPRSFRQ